LRSSEVFQYENLDSCKEILIADASLFIAPNVLIGGYKAVIIKGAPQAGQRMPFHYVVKIS
jgi:hypothetical protein